MYINQTYRNMPGKLCLVVYFASESSGVVCVGMSALSNFSYPGKWCTLPRNHGYTKPKLVV